MSDDSNRNEFGEVVTQLRGYLEFYREIGLTELARPTNTGKDFGELKHTQPVMPVSVAEQRPRSDSPNSTQHSSGKEIQATMAKNPSPAADLFGGLVDQTTTNAPSNETLEDIRADIGDCTRCQLHEFRTNIVFGEGNPKAELLFIGEGPGADEDEQGRPFVGRSGQLLTKIIEAIGMKREDVYIANTVKCRPPQNRTPLREEIATCEGFLFRQIAFIKPKVIVTLGLPATQTILRTKEGITSLRGRFFDYRGSKVLPTFHPAYLLRSPDKKREVWEDMKKVRDYLAGKLTVDQAQE